MIVYLLSAHTHTHTHTHTHNTHTVQTASKTDPDEKNERVCVAEWNNCAYTITSLGMPVYTLLGIKLLDQYFEMTVVLSFRGQCQTTRTIPSIKSLFTPDEYAEA